MDSIVKVFVVRVEFVRRKPNDSITDWLDGTEIVRQRVAIGVLEHSEAVELKRLLKMSPSC
jgi:hypothetical protein